MEQIPAVWLTILRSMLAVGKGEFRAVWPSCQWSSHDGTEDELFEMFRQHGNPGSVEVIATTK